MSSPAWLIILVGIGVGARVGLAGTGGAFIIPTLIFGFGLTQLRAQGTALMIASLPIWIVPLIPYARAKQVDWRLGLVLAIGLTVCSGLERSGRSSCRWGSYARPLRSCSSVWRLSFSYSGEIDEI